VLLGLAAASGILAKSRLDGLGPRLAAHAYISGSAVLVLANLTMTQSVKA
jgi:hypothetical protein